MALLAGAYSFSWVRLHSLDSYMMIPEHTFSSPGWAYWLLRMVSQSGNNSLPPSLSPV